MGKEAFERKLRAIRELRDAEPEAAVDGLRKALKDRSGYAVSKAAEIVADRELADLLPDLVAAFERLLGAKDAVKADPQCWGKTAVARALHQLGCRDSKIFYRGLSCRQPEPSFGGESDSAGDLRGVCALALVDSDADGTELLIRLSDRLLDPVFSVAVNAAVALSRLGVPEAAAPLRLRAHWPVRNPLLRPDNAEVVGQCFFSLLEMDAFEAVPYVSGFAYGDDPEIQAEAVAALASARQPEALERLTRLWRGMLDPDVRRALLLGLAGSPLPKSADFLLEVIEREETPLPEIALEALSTSRFRDKAVDEARRVVEKRTDPGPQAAFERWFA